MPLTKLKKFRKWIITDTINGLSLFTPKKLKQKSTDFRAILALVIVSIVWGTTWVVSKQGVMFIPALQMAGLRQVLGGSIYLIYFILRKYPMPSRQELYPLLVLSFLNFILSNGLSTWGVKYISAGLASIIGAVFPLWIVLISFLTSRVIPPKRAILGIIIGFTGICIIFYDHLIDFLNPDFRFGIFLSVTATISWAVGTIYTKKHARVFNPYFGIGFQMVISGSVLYFISTFDPEYLPLAYIPDITWFAIFYLIIFGSLVGFICYLYALQHLPTQQTSIYAYMNPIVALLTGWIVLDETINPLIVLGCLVTLTGVYFVNRSFMDK